MAPTNQPELPFPHVRLRHPSEDHRSLNSVTFVTILLHAWIKFVGFRPFVENYSPAEGFYRWNKERRSRVCAWRSIVRRTQTVLLPPITF
jgi:hypothetical protein